MSDESVVALSGRRGQAARNDGAILEAARDVFLADPKAPIAAVAERAGVGISALYRRYANKEDLLRRLCADGLRRFIAEAETALAEATLPEVDGWRAFAGFLERIVDADVHSLTVRLAGTFISSPEMIADAQHANELAAELVRRAHAGGRLRADFVTQDVGLLLESCAAIRVADPHRTVQLRRRHLAILLAGLSAGDTPLPGPPPQPGELNGRWRH
jgi:AcrR family transcriptional regulator